MDEWDRMLRQWDAVMMAEMWRDLAESTERLFAKGVPGPWVGPVTFPPVPEPHVVSPSLEDVARRIMDRVTRRIVDAMVEPDADTPHIVGE